MPLFLQHKCASCTTGEALCPECAEDEETLQKKEQAGESGKHQPQETIHSVARGGVESSNEPLPHFERIQASFGRHDVSGVRSAIGSGATQANERMGSLAYTAGDRVAFRREPDVKLSAHEAAHVVQQRSGAKLPGGVGRPGDEYEQQADAVAEAVGRGESAEPILDRTIPGGPSASRVLVQHRLEVNAYREFEPPTVAGGTAAAEPEPAEPGVKDKKAAREAAPPEQLSQSALAQADQGVPAAPATPKTAGPVGGTEADTASGAFNPHCYNADYDEPADDEEGEEPADPESTKPKEEVHPDLPRPDETDLCPIEAQVATQAPPAAAAAVPQASLPAATGSLAAQEGDAGDESGGADANPASTSSNADVQAGAETAASAPSPLEDAVAQAEAGRNDAVSSFQDSDSATRALAPRIDSLSSDSRFFAETPGADAEATRATEARLSDFFRNASHRLNESLTLALEDVPDRFGTTAESLKAAISAALAQQKNQHSANIETARAQAYASAASAHSQVDAEHDATVLAIEEQTASAIDGLVGAHDETISSIDETESAALEDVNTLYSASYDAHVALGPQYADLADARGEQYAEYYEGCKKYNADGTPWKDGFFAGYLTNRRAEAQVKAARETAKGYRKSLIETANDSAAQATKGRRLDRCGIIAMARRTRSAADDRLTTLIETLESGREDSIRQAASKRRTMVASINRGLSSALAVLDLLEHDGRQSLDDTGYLQQLAIEQAAHASATAVQESVVQAVGNVEAALTGLRSTLAANPAPAPEDVDRILAGAAGGLQRGIGVLLASVGASVASATETLEEAGVAAIDALDSDAQTSLERVTTQSDTFSSQMNALATGATAVFGALRDQNAAQAQQTADAGSEGFAQASLGFEQSCETVLDAIATTLGQSEQRLGQEFQKQIGGLDSETTGIPKHAAEAASKEQPAWKSVVAVILIIAIIIVVALVIGPAIIGAVGAAAAALGASAGVATAVGAIVGGAIVGALSAGAMTVVQNWASGQRLTKGLGHAILVGALTGAVGGAIGLGVNAGLNAVLSGGRLAVSAGAQFAVRAVANVTSDALLNIGQQMGITGHVDWGAFAEGVAISLVLHGSRRVQAFQARMTAVGARGVVGGVTRLGGAAEPTAAATRASEFAGQMEHHAATAGKESRKPLDWTRPAPTPETPAAAAPRETAETPATAAPEAAAVSKPVESAPRVTEEPLSPSAVPETEPAPARSTSEEPTTAEPTPAKEVILERTSTKNSDELTPAEATSERDAASRTKGEPVEDPPFTTRKELPNGHEIEETPEGEIFKRCSTKCAIYDRDGNLIESDVAAPREEGASVTTPKEEAAPPTAKSEEEAPSATASKEEATPAATGDEETSLPAGESPEPSKQPWELGERPAKYAKYVRRFAKTNPGEKPLTPEQWFRKTGYENYLKGQKRAIRGRTPRSESGDKPMSPEEWWEKYGSKPPRNPAGGRGDIAHDTEVQRLKADAERLYPKPQYNVTSNQEIPTPSGMRKPDVAVIDTRTGKIVKVYEAARFNASGGFEQSYEAPKITDYEALGIPYEFHPVGPNKPPGGILASPPKPEPSP